MSGLIDKTIWFWKVKTAIILIRTLTRYDAWVLSVAFSHDKCVVSGSKNCKIRIWNIEQDKMMHDLFILKEHDVEIDSVTFSSNDKHLILESDNHKVVIWNTCLGILVAGLFYYHLIYFYTVLISIDSRYVVAGIGDDTASIGHRIEENGWWTFLRTQKLALIYLLLLTW